MLPFFTCCCFLLADPFHYHIFNHPRFRTDFKGFCKPALFITDDKKYFFNIRTPKHKVSVERAVGVRILKKGFSVFISDNNKKTGGVRIVVLYIKRKGMVFCTQVGNIGGAFNWICLGKGMRRC